MFALVEDMPRFRSFVLPVLSWRAKEAAKAAHSAAVLLKAAGGEAQPGAGTPEWLAQALNEGDGVYRP